MTPISLRIDVTKVQAMLLADANICNCPGNLPRDERPSSPRALVIEKDTVARIHAVRLAVVHRDPVCVQFGDTIWATRVERRGLALWGLDDLSIEFRGRSLVEPRVFFEANGADGVKETQGADTIDIGGIF